MHPGNFINVTGGFQSQRDRVESTMIFCIDELLPRHRTLDIQVHIGNYEATENVMGQCLHVTGNEFHVDIDSKQNLYNLIVTTCHEMVHVKQYSKGELKESYPNTLWFNKSHSDARCYPWEREAWDMQKPLAHKYILEHTSYTIKGIKVLDKRS